MLIFTRRSIQSNWHQFNAAEAKPYDPYEGHMSAIGEGSPPQAPLSLCLVFYDNSHAFR